MRSGKENEGEACFICSYLHMRRWIPSPEYETVCAAANRIHQPHDPHHYDASRARRIQPALRAIPPFKARLDQCVQDLLDEGVRRLSPYGLTQPDAHGLVALALLQNNVDELFESPEVFVDQLMTRGVQPESVKFAVQWLHDTGLLGTSTLTQSPSPAAKPAALPTCG